MWRFFAMIITMMLLSKILFFKNFTRCITPWLKSGVLDIWAMVIKSRNYGIIKYYFNVITTLFSQRILLIQLKEIQRITQKCSSRCFQEKKKSAKLITHSAIRKVHFLSFYFSCTKHESWPSSISQFCSWDIIRNDRFLR